MGKGLIGGGSGKSLTIVLAATWPNQDNWIRSRYVIGNCYERGRWVRGTLLPSWVVWWSTVRFLYWDLEWNRISHSTLLKTAKNHYTACPCNINGRPEAIMGAVCFIDIQCLIW